MDDPHGDQPVERAGVALDEASVAVVLVHGRNALARTFLELVREFEADGVAYLAPQAADGSWYPSSFLAPRERNEPHLSSALGAVEAVVDDIEASGLPRERIVALGFSQGACLTTEFVARAPERYGGVVAFSGGLIGPTGTEFDFAGDLDDTPVFLGCSDVDPYVPVERLHETRDAFVRLGGDVETRVYEDMDHTVNEDEIAYADDLLRRIADSDDA